MTGTSKKLITNADIEAFIERFDTFLFDCDGVIWHGQTLIPNVANAIQLLRSRGKRLLFVTNNSTQSRASYKKKFERLGLSVKEEEIFGSAYAAAIYMTHHLPKNQKVYVIGQAGICDELANASIPYEHPEEDNTPIDFDQLDEIQPNPQIGAVLVGFDGKINYRKFAKAYVYLTSNPQCQFIATNTDASFPHHGRTFPGTGTIVAAIQGATGIKPKILGKPHQTMLDCIQAKYHLNLEKTCMVGDRLNTDIQFGIEGGMSTLLVLTGVTTESELHKPDQTIIPEYYIDSLGNLANLE
jgi:4-nitrophenyl phosphatase